jgi:hypothetical protein
MEIVRVNIWIDAIKITYAEMQLFGMVLLPSISSQKKKV